MELFESVLEIGEELETVVPLTFYKTPLLFEFKLLLLFPWLIFKLFKGVLLVANSMVVLVLLDYAKID